jgi:hypothetical protein
LARWCAGQRGRDRGRLVVWRSLLNHRWAGPAKALSPGRVKSHTRCGRPLALIRRGGAGHALRRCGWAASAVCARPGGRGTVAVRCACLFEMSMRPTTADVWPPLANLASARRSARSSSPYSGHPPPLYRAFLHARRVASKVGQWWPNVQRQRSRNRNTTIQREMVFPAASNRSGVGSVIRGTGLTRRADREGQKSGGATRRRDHRPPSTRANGQTDHSERLFLPLFYRSAPAIRSAQLVESGN